MRLPAFVLAAIGSLACGSDPSGPPDDIVTLFTGSCAGDVCHAGTDAPAEGLDLSADAMCAELIGVPSRQAPELVLVAPGSPETSYLLCKIDPGCDRGETALMPLGTAGLPAESIDAVARWIGGGAAGCPAADETAPEFAGAASAAGLTSAIRIEWSPASDDVSPASAIVYEIYEADSPGAQSFADPSYVTAPGATSFTAVPLPISTTRYYVVRARDSAGNLDDNQVEVSATTSDTADQTPPEFAGIRAAVPAGSSGLSLSWSPATDNVTPPELLRYRAYVATAAGGQELGSPAGQSAPGASELLISGLAIETTYYIVVRAVDALGNEDANTVEVAATTASALSFSADVQPIFDASCSANACHDGVNPAEGLDLRASSAHASLVGVPASQCGERLRVTPGDPEASYLIDKLRGVDLCSGSRMPKGAPLPAAQVQVIADWVAQGAPDN